VNSRFYDVPGFLKGNDTLPEPDRQAVGDVQGRTLLHLQCHFGLDTLSWARNGAIVTGVDLSDISIERARSLATQAKLDAKFVCCNVLDAAERIQNRFDIVYTSWGALLWLPDMANWAQTVWRLVRDGGVLHIIEFHPAVYMVEDGEFKHDYFNTKTYDEVTVGTYTDGGDSMMPLRSISWSHSLADMIQPTLSVGFHLESICEYDFSPYGCFENMVEDKPGEWVIEKFGRSLPYGVSLKFRKPSDSVNPQIP